MTDSRHGEFFSRNVELFTVLGVFAAVSVYFTQLNLDSKWKRLGTVSSLTIFLIVAIAIQKNISPPSKDRTPFDYVADHNFQRKGLAIFYISFYGVVISISVIVIQYSGTFLFLMSFLLFTAGVNTTTWLIDQLDFPDDWSGDIGEPSEFPLIAAYIVRNAAWAAILGGGGLVLMYASGNLPIELISQFKMNSAIVGVLVGYLTGLLAGGLLFVATFSGIALMHYRFLSMKNAGTWDEFVEAFNNLPWTTEEEETVGGE
jgi:hypothetical protein